MGPGPAGRLEVPRQRRRETVGLIVVGAPGQERRPGGRAEEGRPLAGPLGVDTGPFQEEMLVEDLDHRFELAPEHQLAALRA